jgi:L-lactate dehydrogenase complex protein LldG
MNQAKQNILSRLKRNKTHKAGSAALNLEGFISDTPARQQQELIEKLTENHIEVHRVKEDSWPSTLCTIARNKGVSHWLLGQGLGYQDEAQQALLKNDDNVSITRYDQAYETLRTTLFHDIDASLSLAQAAIAETGTLVLIPDQNEPRMLSLAPPLHVIKLDTKDIYPSLSKLIAAPPWSQDQDMPSNILFISSPSKTADIQQTLAYGAHGPKEVIVLLVED